MSRIAGMNAAAAISKKLSTEEGLQEVAKIQADELGLQNQAKIELAREDLSDRATGTTNYGQDVEGPVSDYLARNASQDDIARQQSLARGEGESAKAHLDRLAMDPNAALNRVAMEERTFRQTKHYAEREGAIREYLARGAQNVRDPNLQRLASEFVASYPREYERLKAEMRGGGGGQETAPFDPELLAQIQSGEFESERDKASRIAFAKSWVDNSVVPRLEAKAGRKLTDQEVATLVQFHESRNKSGFPVLAADLMEGSPVAEYMQGEIDRGSATGEAGATSAGRTVTQQMKNRFDGLDKSKRQLYLDAAGGDESKAAMLHDQQLRKDRGIDAESGRARQDEVARSRAIEAISGRHGNDPSMVRRAIENWNSRNPNNPLRPDDFGMPPAGQNVTARPGEVVEVDDIRSINPRNVSPGSILVDASGAARMARRPDGGVYGQPVLQDRNSGFYFPDPDKYSAPEQFNAAMSRQDRVNMRQAIVNSGNSVLASEQRRLDAARQAAASSIPEIREAGVKEVDELERELHWRYISESASLAGPAATGGRQEYEISAPPGARTATSRATKEITPADALGAYAEYAGDLTISPQERSRLKGMTREEREAFGRQLLQPYGSEGMGEQSVADLTASLSEDQLAVAEARRSPMRAGGLNLPSLPPGSSPEQVAEFVSQNSGQILDYIKGRYKTVLPNPSKGQLTEITKSIEEELQRAGLFSEPLSAQLMQIEQRMIDTFRYSGFEQNGEVR